MTIVRIIGKDESKTKGCTLIVGTYDDKDGQTCECEEFVPPDLSEEEALRRRLLKADKLEQTPGVVWLDEEQCAYCGHKKSDHMIPNETS